MCFILAPFYSSIKNLNAFIIFLDIVLLYFWILFIIFLDIVYYIILYFWILFIIFLDIKFSKYSQKNSEACRGARARRTATRGTRASRAPQDFSRKCMPKPTWKMNRDSARVQLTEEAKELIPSSNMQWIMAKAWECSSPVSLIVHSALRI